MPDARLHALAAVTTIVFIGTLCSIHFETYLDTSNPLLANLPHHLHETHYFASKGNFLNVYFIKQAWGWTSLVFFLTFFTSPPRTRTKGSLYKWLAATAAWFIFTRWFVDHVVLYSGGECVLYLPAGEVLTVPADYCFSKSTLSPITHPTLFTSLLRISDDVEWHGIPRLRRGHDVSGHIFLLTLSILFLADQLRLSFRGERWSDYHKCAVIANVGLISIWLFASYTTSVYFHSPSEKLTGYLLGVAAFAFTQLPILQPLPIREDTRSRQTEKPQQA